VNSGYELLEHLPAAVYTTDAKGHITFYNRAAAELWGQRPDLGALWCGSWRLYHADGRPMAHDECPMAICLKEARPVRGAEAILETPQGKRIWFTPYPTPIFDAAGRLTGAINLLVDTSDRHWVEDDLARLAAIVSSSDDAIISKTLDGRITSWNDGAARIFGYGAEEMIGHPITRIIPPELHEEEKEIIRRLAAGERIDHYETVRIAKDGRRIDISLSVSPLCDRLGRVIGASKVARDITERKQAAEMQVLLLNELNHRIKNTLAMVQAIASQTLRRSPSPAAFVSSFTGRIQALARAHGALAGESFNGADVHDLLRDQLLLGGVDDSRISWAGPSARLQAQAALHVALVIHELGANARKYGALSSPSGRVSVTWEVRNAGGRTLLLNWVESGGPKVVAPSGRGFGSILIEQSLQAMCGEVSMTYAESGLRCAIALPLPAEDPLRAAPRPRMNERKAPALTERSNKLAGKRVLVVEDEPLIAMAIEDCLSAAGCTVIGPAHTVANAKALLESTEFEAALLDGNLAGRSADEIAANLVRRGAPFAFVSGYGRQALPEAFREAPLIEKPFTPEQLLSALERLIDTCPNMFASKAAQRAATRDAS
jgi:PAS domain S-box-containing protein